MLVTLTCLTVTERRHEQSLGANEGHASEASGPEPARGHALVPRKDLTTGGRGPNSQGWSR